MHPTAFQSTTLQRWQGCPTSLGPRNSPVQPLGNTPTVLAMFLIRIAECGPWTPTFSAKGPQFHLTRRICRLIRTQGAACTGADESRLATSSGLGMAGRRQLADHQVAQGRSRKVLEQDDRSLKFD